MTACVNCARALQPAWKYCIYCGTRTGVAATAPRSRPMPKRTPVPGYASVTTSQTPIVPPAAPAPLSAAPADEPVSSEWPEALGERPSLKSALAATDVPAPTPPREDAPAPEGEEEQAGLAALAPPDHFADALADEEDDDEPLPMPTGLSIADLAHETDFDDEPVRAADPQPEAEPEPEPEIVAEDEPGEVEELAGRRSRTRRGGRNGRASTAVLEEAPEVVEDEIAEDAVVDEDAPEERRRSVNTLAILALFIGILACPFAALFGHLALGQLKVSGERGVIPAWIAVVLGYLWLGFWIVFGVTYLATNG